MKKNCARIAVMLAVMLAASLMVTDGAFAKSKDKYVFKTLKAGKWTKTYKQCNKYNKKKKNYTYTYYKINIPEDSVITFSIKGKKKNSDYCSVNLYTSKKRAKQGGYQGHYEKLLWINEPLVLKKGSYYMTWGEDSKGKTKIKYTYHKITYSPNTSMQRAAALSPGKTIYAAQTERNHAPRWYRLDLKTAKRIYIQTQEDAFNAYLNLYDKNGNLIECDCKYMVQKCVRVPYPAYTKRVLPAGTYYLKMDAWGQGESYSILTSKISFGHAIDIRWN